MLIFAHDMQIQVAHALCKQGCRLISYTADIRLVTIATCYNCPRSPLPIRKDGFLCDAEQLSPIVGSREAPHGPLRSGPLHFPPHCLTCVRLYLACLVYCWNKGCITKNIHILKDIVDAVVLCDKQRFHIEATGMIVRVGPIASNRGNVFFGNF